MVDAGKTTHMSHYCGYMYLRTEDGKSKPVMAYLTPTIAATIISLAAICQQYKAIRYSTSWIDLSDKSGSLVFLDEFEKPLVSIRLSLHCNLQWTDTLNVPTASQQTCRIPQQFVSHSYTISGQVISISANYVRCISILTVSRNYLNQMVSTTVPLASPLSSVSKMPPKLYLAS
jgi:hypothetical protein